VSRLYPILTSVAVSAALCLPMSAAQSAEPTKESTGAKGGDQVATPAPTTIPAPLQKIPVEQDLAQVTKKDLATTNHITAFQIDENGLAHVKTVPVDGRNEAQNVLKRLESDPTTTSVSTDHVSTLLTDKQHATPFATNDPENAVQWHFPKLGLETAWNTATGDGVVVGVVDTGVDTTHPDLVANLIPGQDFTSAPAPMSDTHGHGTHVAGIIAATTNNSIGVAGVAPNAKIMPLKVFETSGEAYNSNISTAIVYGVQNGVDIINLSLGSQTGDPVLYDAILYAYRQGVLVVAAGGNYRDPDNREGESPKVWPAVWSETLAVAATDQNDSQALFSNQNSYIDIAAPGVQIASTFKDGQYAYMSGTSMAAPVVAGVAALLEQHKPGLSAQTNMSTLTDTAQDLGVFGRDNSFGYGLVQPSTALGYKNPAKEPFPYPKPGDPIPDAGGFPGVPQPNPGPGLEPAPDNPNNPDDLRNLGKVEFKKITQKGKKVTISWTRGMNATIWWFRISQRNDQTNFKPWEKVTKKSKTLKLKPGKYGVQVKSANHFNVGKVTTKRFKVKR